jgi:hypothetical protein
MTAFDENRQAGHHHISLKVSFRNTATGVICRMGQVQSSAPAFTSEDQFVSEWPRNVQDVKWRSQRARKLDGAKGGDFARF